MNHKLHILFFLYRSKANSNDTMPIFCRITINGKRKQFSTGCALAEVYWDKQSKLCKGHSSKAKRMNNNLKAIEKKLWHSYDRLTRTSGQVDVNDLYNQYCDKVVKKITLLDVFDHHINQIKTLVGKDYSVATYQKYILIRRHVQEFIKSDYKIADYQLNQLRLGFLHDFDYFLKLKKNQNQNTVNKTIERVKKVINIAVAHGWLYPDPFALYRKKRYVKEVIFLNSEELQKLEQYQFSERLTSVKNIFIFSCYTGLAYREVCQLRKEHIKKNKTGLLWIEMIRQKTKRPISVLLLPKALRILNFYDYCNSNDCLLPIISNQKLNLYLKEIADIIGLTKHLTHHVARKTFASTVLLDNDIPIDVASFLLGHSKVSTTEEFYAKVQRERVALHLSKLIK